MPFVFSSSVILMFVIFLILFISFLVIHASRLNEENFKTFVISSLVCFGLYCGAEYLIKNPQITNYYQTDVKDKKIITTTSTYKCGESRCTKTKKEYYIYGEGHRSSCREEVSSFTYYTTHIGDLFSCSEQASNYMLLDKEKFIATKEISNTYKKLVPSRHSFDLFKQKYFYNIQYVNFSIFPVNTNNFINKFRHAILDKGYVINVVFTTEDRDYIYALNDKWKGANPYEIILIYSLSKNNDNKINWVNLITYANNDQNEKLTADFISQNLDFKILTEEKFFNDLKYIQEHYFMVDENKYENLSESYATASVNWLFIIFVIIYLTFLFFFHKILITKY